MQTLLIVSSARTAVGRRKRPLRTSPGRMAATAIGESGTCAGVRRSISTTVSSAAHAGIRAGSHVALIASLRAGIPVDVGGGARQSLLLSGLQVHSRRAIMCGFSRAIIAGAPIVHGAGAATRCRPTAPSTAPYVYFEHRAGIGEPARDHKNSRARGGLSRFAVTARITSVRRRFAYESYRSFKACSGTDGRAASVLSSL